MSEFNKSKYIYAYTKENYVRKEIKFRKEDWTIIDKVLQENNITLKEIIENYVKEKSSTK